MSDFKPGLDGVIATDTNVSYLDVDNEDKHDDELEDY